MKLWMLFVVGAFLAWGAYVPVVHEGQMLLKGGALKAFMCVGAAYVLTAVLVPAALLGLKVESADFNRPGVVLSLIAGVLGAAGALFMILSLKFGGNPFVVAPIVFACAPVVNTLVAAAWHRPKSPPQIWFYVGLLMAAGGAYLVLRFRPH